MFDNINFEKDMISVIVPVYNVENYISKCLDSLISQSYRNLEILLVDDGSTDSSGKICEIYAKKDDRIHVYHKKNGGVSSARNLGLNYSRGEYITFVDPDDWLDHDMYMIMVEGLKSSECDAVFCGYWETPEEETGLNKIMHKPLIEGVFSGNESLYYSMLGIGYGYFTSVWNKIFKRNAISNGFENYKISEDELWLAKNLPLISKVLLISEPLYYWRIRDNSALRSNEKYDKWYDAFDAKQKVICLTEDKKEVYYLSKAKMYNDLFDVVWISYVNYYNDISRDFLKKLSDYKKDFLINNKISKLKKAKYLTLELLINIRFPRFIIRQIGNINGYRLKEKIYENRHK